VKNQTPDTKDSLVWKWTKGADTDADELGDPTADDGYVLCLYGDTENDPTLLTELSAPPGGLCAGKPCWKRLGSPPGAKGVKYADKETTPTGVLGLLAKPGADGKAKMVVKAKGPLLRTPAMPVTAFPVRAQLQGAGSCWEAEYDEANVSANRADLLKVKGPKPAAGGRCQLDADCARPADTADCGPNAFCNPTGHCIDPDDGSALCNPDTPPPPRKPI
jgi:hypothetical protein